MKSKLHTPVMLNSVSLIISAAAIICLSFAIKTNNKTIILIPNQGQFQQILNAIEPNNPLKVDYHIGTDSRDKWDWIVFNEYAAEYMTPSGGPKE